MNQLKFLWKIRKDLWSGYSSYFMSLIKPDPKIEKLAEYRWRVIENSCWCKKYYLTFKLFGKTFKWFPYCENCGCLLDVKVRCTECHCDYKRW